MAAPPVPPGTQRLEEAGERCCAGRPGAKIGILAVRVAAALAVFFVSGRAAAWEIESFDVNLAVQPDSSVVVTETIRVDFQDEQRHGIYRDIPLVTQDRLGMRRSIRLVYLGAVDEEGRPWRGRVSREGVYRRIRLGSPGVTYRGHKTFRITYRVERLLQSFPDHDELYWNATGNRWAVPMRRAQAAVRLPKPVPAGPLRSVAYTGAYGSTAQDVRITLLGEDTVQYDVSRPLNAFEGLTVVVGWPSGRVSMPTRGQKLAWFFQDHGVLFIPLAVLLLMTCLWWNFGRDLPRGTISVQYEPPERLTPAEVGALADDNVDLRDITATIMDLARRGFLTIEELKGEEYLFTRRRSVEGAREGRIKTHEALLLKSLFQSGGTVSLSDLENEFYQHLPGLKTALYDGLCKQGYWWGRPDRVRAFWWGVAGATFFLGVLTLNAFPDPGLPFAALFLSAGGIFAFSWFMPRKTPQGARVAERVLGFEEFLRRTDEDRLKRETDPGALFERMLPHAMALGVASQWAAAFEGIYRVAPAWYTSYNGAFFTPGDFTRRLRFASDRMGASLASAPRSSGGSGFGGGFSGGGGGGGGGGSW